MTNHVKNFIEENIESIEQEDWYTVFYSWYQHWGSKDVKLDYSRLDELMICLSRVMDKDIEEETKDVREQLVTEFIEHKLHMLAVYKSDLTIVQMLTWLKSDLGLRLHELTDIVILAAEAEGYKVDKTRGVLSPPM